MGERGRQWGWGEDGDVEELGDEDEREGAEAGAEEGEWLEEKGRG